MKFYLISDDRDALTGMHLAGIDGEYCESAASAEAAMRNAVENKDIGILLITDSIAQQCAQAVSDIKLSYSTPLLVEIPNSDSSECPGDSIMKIVHDAIGI